MNVEALSRVQPAIDLCAEFIGQRRTIVNVDESTKIKGPDAARTLAVIELAKRAYARRIATGLVAPRSPMDLFSQFEFLDYRILGFKSFYAFRSRYAIMVKQQFGKFKRGEGGRVLTDGSGVALREGPLINTIVGYRNPEELHDKIAPYSYRVLKENCLDLPPKIYLPPRDVDLTDEQRRVLKDLKNTAQAQLSSGAYVTATQKMTMLLRMHQVLCGHVVDEDETVHTIPSNRTNELLEVLEECQGKVIIWSGFIYSIKEIINALSKEYGPESVVHFYGATKARDRMLASQRFQEDPACRFIVSNQQTGGMGNTWHAASLVVHYSNTHNLEDRLQSEDRAHRDGLDHPVAYVDLQATENNFERKLIEALRKKLDIATIISGDSYREWII